jgi:hypothetical protein
MSNPNFVNDLVMMAKAFEELPKVQAELNTAHTQIEEYAKRVQTLEMRLIDRANEIDNLNAKVRTVEVERDHAETMFLETDEQFNRAKDVLKVLIGNAGDFLRVVEPPKPEPVAEPKPPAPTEAEYRDAQATMQGQSEPHPTTATESSDSSHVAPTLSVASGEGAGTTTEEAPHSVDPTSAPSWAANTLPQGSAPDVGGVSGESAASSTTGESATDPTAVAQSSETGDAVISGTAFSSENASASSTTDSSSQKEGSVSSDPTPATESSSESGSSALASPPEPELRYSPEWYQWADAVGYWNRKEAAQ